MTYVTCPIRRYHPAVVAQKAATDAAALRWSVHARARRGREPERAHRRRTAGRSPACATRCSTRPSRSSAPCWSAATVTHRGEHFQVESAKALGPARTAAADRHRRLRAAQSCQIAGRTRRPDDRRGTPSRALLDAFDRARWRGQAAGRARSPVCRTTPTGSGPLPARTRQFRWFAGGWRGQRRTPRAGRLRRREPVRTPAGRVGVHPLRRRRGDVRGRRARVHRRRVYRGRPGADRRGDAGAVPRLGRKGPPARPAGALKPATPSRRHSRSQGQPAAARTQGAVSPRSAVLLQPTAVHPWSAGMLKRPVRADAERAHQPTRT